jgi:hypothetical protein
MQGKIRAYIDTSVFEARNMVVDGNADFRFWFDKSIAERLKGSAVMNAAAFREPNFMKGKVDRTIYASKKRT